MDTKLTPNRVRKLFRDTSYSNPEGLDTNIYNDNNLANLNEILKHYYEKN